ncbi:hypothetical protein LPJ56_000676 [Coemansia sp. RSA 2599]|nr:hypothetical protein LPJ75_000344 [Coemansia sp. RSA 2598]KAJ1829042.1 hypothetical protein LPJ56_000676 [Coemansia sp. RSA 2599]
MSISRASSYHSKTGGDKSLTLCLFYVEDETKYIKRVEGKFDQSFQAEFEKLVRRHIRWAKGKVDWKYLGPGQQVTYETRDDALPYCYERLENGGTVVLVQRYRLTRIDRIRRYFRKIWWNESAW